MGVTYTPPAGGLDVPHPRFPLLIVLKSIEVHCFALAACALLLRLLPALTGHRLDAIVRNGQRTFSAFFRSFSIERSTRRSWPFLLPCLLLPIYIPANLGLRILLPLLLDQASLPSLLALRQPLAPLDAAFSVFLAVFVSVPLANTLSGYRTRLAMTYHGATYVGALGVDHRNGWIAAAGLLAAALTIVVALVRTAFARPVDDADALEATPAKDAEAAGKGEAGPSEQWRETCWGTWSPLAEAGLAALVQQPLLLLTKHVAPLLSPAARPLLLLIAILGFVLYRRRDWRADMVAKLVVGILVLATVIAQAAWDAWEFWGVLHGRYANYNYRWAVRDDFWVISAKRSYDA